MKISTIIHLGEEIVKKSKKSDKNVCIFREIIIVLCVENLRSDANGPQKHKKN